MRITVDYEWRSIGEVTIGADGRVTFPALPAEPGIYQLDFRSGPNSVLYVGEAVDLKRRAYNYRNPGPTQRTSIRINARLKEHIAAGGTVVVVATTAARMEIAGSWSVLDLSSKAARVLVESAALLVANKSAIPVENL